jgi:hypothetical protein
MELLDHIQELRELPDVKFFLDKYHNSLGNIFGINYKNNNRVSFKLYSTINSLEELKYFDSTIFKKCEKYFKFMWEFSGLFGGRGFHVGLKLKNNQVVKYFHCKFKPNIYLFSVPYQECSFQGMSVESTGEIRPYFYYFSKEIDKYKALKCNNLQNILSDLNYNSQKSADEIFHIEYTVTDSYRKMNLGSNFAPFDEFRHLDRQAKIDSLILENFFNQKIITTGKYNDEPNPTIAIYFYDCFKKLLN